MLYNISRPCWYYRNFRKAQQILKALWFKLPLVSDHSEYELFCSQIQQHEVRQPTVDSVIALTVRMSKLLSGEYNKMYLFVVYLTTPSFDQVKPRRVTRRMCNVKWKR